ncbi:MAG: PKD domain-containing protein [Candidatus Peregrinibacteria bacterium]
MKKLILFIIIALFEAFPAVSNANYAPLKFSEINFKDSKSDWIEISVISPPSETIKIKDDKLIAEIPPGLIKNEKYILIHFKSSSAHTESQNSVLHIYSTSSGLTGTTEQITIETTSGIMDTVCWKNDSPTDQEQKDMEELLSGSFWIGECIDSDTVKKGQSIAKTLNPNEAASWQIFNHPTQGEENKIKNSPPHAEIKIQKGNLEFEVPASINLDGSQSYDPDGDSLSYKWTFPDNKIVEKKNPSSYKFGNSGNYEISLTVKDPLGLSDTAKIQINALPKINSEFTDRIEKLKPSDSKKPSPTSSTSNLITWETTITALAIMLIIPLIHLYGKSRAHSSKADPASS